MASCLGCYFALSFVMGWVRVGVVMKAFHVPFSQLGTYRYQCHNRFPCSSQATESWITGFSMVSGNNTGYEYSHLYPHHYSRITDPDKVFRGSLAHRCQHGHRVLHRSWIAAWTLVAKWATDINVDPSCSRTSNQDLALSCVCTKTQP